jgi:hypothetical protein
MAQWSVTFWLAAQLVVAVLRIASAAVGVAPVKRHANCRKPFSNLSSLDRVATSVRMTLMPTPRKSSQSAEIQGARLSSFGV